MGVCVAVTWIMGFAVDAEICMREGEFDDFVEIQFAQCIEASDGLFGVELVRVMHQCIEG